MKIKYFSRQLLLFAAAFTLVLSEDWNYDENGEQAENQYGENQDDDGMGFFNYNDEYDWSEYAMYPKKCITDSDGIDYVVFDMYGEGHNQCKKKSMGTYKATVQYFVKAYVKQKTQEAEKYGGDYAVDDESINFLYCQQYAYNNNYFFVQVGCRDNSGLGFQLHTYTDQYCNERSTSQNYNLGIDVSSLMVAFEYCKDCVVSSNNGNYNNGNYNNGGGNYYNAYQDQEWVKHESPLCGAAWNYKESCNRSCKRAAKGSSSSKSSSGGDFFGEPFSGIGKFFLWVMGSTAVFFLLAGLAQRKKLSKSDAVLEDAAIKSAGIDKKFIPRIIISYACFIIFLILFKRKILTWFFLTGGNIGLLWYYCHLRGRNEENSEKLASIGGDYEAHKPEAASIS